jgi:hypothetical protein
VTDGNNPWLNSQTQQDFQRARYRALLGALSDLVRRQPSAMLAFDQVRRRCRARGRQ